jgi:hypothetical protein
MTQRGVTRREVFRRSGGLLALPALVRAELAAAAETAAPAPLALEPGPRIYESIGVQPLVNARGTYTILSGSLMLPKVTALSLKQPSPATVKVWDPQFTEWMLLLFSFDSSAFTVTPVSAFGVHSWAQAGRARIPASDTKPTRASSFPRVAPPRRDLI